MDLDDNQKFEALKMRYEDHVDLLRFMTKLDVQIFSGYITVQLAIGAWIASNPIKDIAAKYGLILIDFVFATVTAILLYNDYARRKEVVGIIKNITDALSFNEPNVYLRGKKINVETKPRPWFFWFILGVFIAFVGVSMVAFGAIKAGKVIKY